jgi:hypothetical protein
VATRRSLPARRTKRPGTFQEHLNGTLRSHRGREVSRRDGFADGTLVIAVAEGDVIAVKSGVTTAAFTVTGCLNDNGDGFD